MIDAHRIDKLADQFEAVWKSGKRISADAFLAGTDLIDSDGATYVGEILQELQLVEKELQRKYPEATVHFPSTVIKRIGNYEFLESIGRGGMGELYRARHVLLDKIVAVKVLPEAIAENPLATKRFERELKLIGNLSHPNIVQAHGAEQIGGQLLLVMEYIDGENLQQMIAAGKKRPIDEVLAITRQVAAGLQYAHERKIIHRDIKPANIMLTRDGIAKILDFGLGKFYDEMLLADLEDQSGPLTKLGSPIGTLDYLSPEQWNDPSGVDIRADIYGLGCTFYTLIVGEVPYPSNRFRSIREKMTAHVSQSMPSFLSSGIVIDPAIEAILRKMCAKDRNERFATPQDVLNAIDEYQHNRVRIAQAVQHRWRRRTFAGTVIAVVCSFGLILFLLPDRVSIPSLEPIKVQQNGEDAPSVILRSSISPPPVQEILAARYGGDLRAAQRLSENWLDEAEKISPPTPELQSHIAVASELLADCTLYGRNSTDRSYEFYVEEAKELYLQAMALTDNVEKRSLLKSKRAILQMISGNPSAGLEILKAGAEPVVSEADDDSGKSILFFEAAQGIGAESHALRQESLRRLLNELRLGSPAIATLPDDYQEWELFDLQMLCIRQLLKSGLALGDRDVLQRDAAEYLSPILLGTMASRRELHPYLRQDFEWAIRCYSDNLLKQAEYIYSMRMDDTLRTGSARLIFYFTDQESFVIFLPSHLSEGKKIVLPWTRRELRNAIANRSPLELDEQLVALVQAEWDADRRVSLSWSDEICFALRNERLSYADWAFETQLKLRLFVGIEK